MSFNALLRVINQVSFKCSFCTLYEFDTYKHESSNKISTNWHVKHEKVHACGDCRKIAGLFHVGNVDELYIDQYDNKKPKSTDAVFPKIVFMIKFAICIENK